MSYVRQVEGLVRQLSIAPFLDDLASADTEAVDLQTWTAIVEQAARFAEGVVDPLDAALDGIGAALRDGRVVTAPGHREAWARFAGDGWLTLALPSDAGGQDLPLLLTTACEELFNRASSAFTMLATPNRTAAA